MRIAITAAERPSTWAATNPANSVAPDAIDAAATTRSTIELHSAATP